MKKGSGSQAETPPLYDEGMHPGVFVVPVGLLLVFAPILLAMKVLLGFFVSALKGLAGAGHAPAMGFDWVFLLVFGPFTVLLLAVVAIVAVGYRTTRVQLTRERLRFKTRFLSCTEAEMGISDIESVFLRRPPLGRLLGYGTVIVVGRGGTPFNLAFLPEPERLHRGILDLRSKQ